MQKLRISKILLIIFLYPAVFYNCKKETKYNNTNKDTSLTNISYGKHSKQTIDIVLPAKRDSTTPVLLLIHGGAWRGGQKEDFNFYISLIKNKWKEVAIINMNYRLASNANNIHHNEIMADIDSVIYFIIKNKKTYNISSKIGIMGASAGGQLAMIYAYKLNNFKNIKCIANFFGPSIINDWTWYNSYNLILGAKVGDILTEYVGQTWDTTAYKAASPFWNIDSNSLPTIIFHGNLDPVVPVYQSQYLYSKLNSLKVKTEYHEYVAFHGFDNNQSDEVINKTIAFFKTYLK